MRRRSLLHLGLLAALLTLGSACLSPTLPLPPPEPDSVLEAKPGTWLVSGSCSRGAMVTVFNLTRHQGVVAEDREQLGRYSIEIEATLCDTGSVSETLGQESSTEAPFQFDKPTATSSSSCH